MKAGEERRWAGIEDRQRYAGTRHQVTDGRTLNRQSIGVGEYQEIRRTERSEEGGRRVMAETWSFIQSIERERETERERG